MEQKLELWQRFCDRYMSDNLGIPLFSVNNNGIVEIKEYGQNQRLILKRSEEMEILLISEVEKVLNDFYEETKTYDGLIYMMYKFNNDLVTPLYIGKSEKYGKSNNLSANIKGIGQDKKDRSKFCRWGDNYAYHFGDLSAVVCFGHPEKEIRRKYQKWADNLFEFYPTNEPKLKEDIYFWIHAWQPQNIGIFPEFGDTLVTALEYQLISVAATIFSDSLLNEEGVNRRKQYIWFILFHLYSSLLSQQMIHRL
ncbi:hypothetical protein [Crocosphaera sp. XPORK-15E]|uniref:hypothetical protein n=1 Tax=Crocosphaera sp. XPORK-15E TaxID=3110247 RepID=UPI002B2013C7|nr:hypothetical protein [Crocosphaera sp. XPORK-15E]MEA5536672.1 hypothetical protein [Crocosphaera sp. XPORK-15E]